MALKFLPVFMACCFCGCIDLRMESREDQVSDKTTYETVSVAVDSFSEFNPRLVRTEENRGEFSLSCEGKYRIVRRRTSDVERTGRHALSVGLFPGIYWASEAVDGTDYSEWPLSGVKILLANCVAGVPTILSLFFEPFDSYHDEKCGFWSAVAGYGLVGCCKRSQWRPWTKRYAETRLETISVPSYVLSDYTVVVAGNAYRCERDKKSVSITVPGEDGFVNIQIESVPAMKGELERYVSSLKGLELEIEVESK